MYNYTLSEVLYKYGIVFNKDRFEQLKNNTRVEDVDAILSYLIDGRKYYARNVDELNSIFLHDKPLNERKNFGAKLVLKRNCQSKSCALAEFAVNRNFYPVAVCNPFRYRQA